jgi:hypothetical protein
VGDLFVSLCPVEASWQPSTADEGFEIVRRRVCSNRFSIAMPPPAAMLAAPEQRQEVRPGRDVFQSRTTAGGKTYLT